MIALVVAMVGIVAQGAYAESALPASATHAASATHENPALAPRAFLPGEVLRYQVGWAGIPAGTATMAVATTTDALGRDVLRFTSTVDSNGVVSAFYPVRDRVQSDVDPVTGAPHRIEIDQRHARRVRVRTTVFDQWGHRATTFQPGRDPITVDIPVRVHDILSCLYALRNHARIEPGEPIQLDVHEGKKNWRLRIDPQVRERVRVPAGTFDTVRVRAEVRFQGVFFDRGDVRIWFTDDERHIPVQIKIKIKIGSVYIALAEISGPTITAGPGP